MSSFVRNLIAGTGALALTGLAFAFAIAPVMVDTAGAAQGMIA